MDKHITRQVRAARSNLLSTKGHNDNRVIIAMFRVRDGMFLKYLARKVISIYS